MTGFTVFTFFNLKRFQCNKKPSWQSTISLSAGKVECLYRSRSNFNGFEINVL